MYAMLWVGQFGIVDGEAREDTPWVGVFRDPGRGDEPSDLYAIIEPALPGSEEFCAELKEALGRVFHRQKVSLTGGLLRALKAAHENLRDWNRRSMKDHRVAAGVSCLAVREGEGCLALVAPASAVHYSRGVLDQLAPVIPDALEPLGLHDEFWPQFYRFDFSPGDRLLILSPAFARTLTHEELESALQLPPEEAIPELYRHARFLANCGALLVAAQAPAGEPAGA